MLRKRIHWVWILIGAFSSLHGGGAPWFLNSDMVVDDTIYYSTPYDSCRQAHPICGDTSMIFLLPPFTYPPFYECCTGINYHTPCCIDWYRCLVSNVIDTPRWYLLRINSPGRVDILIYILSYVSFPQPYIISFAPTFILWGPSDTPTGACTAGLVDGKAIDCHDDWNYLEHDTATVPYGNAGEFYLLMLESYNFTMDPFYLHVQSLNVGAPGYATLDCDMVIHCSILRISVSTSTCDPATNTFTLSGQVYFVNPPQTGNLVIWDNNTGYATQITPPFSHQNNSLSRGCPVIIRCTQLPQCFGILRVAL